MFKVTLAIIVLLCSTQSSFSDSVKQSTDLTNINIGDYGKKSISETASEQKVRKKKNWKATRPLLNRVSTQELEKKVDLLVKNGIQADKEGLEPWDGNDNRILVKMPFKLREYFLRGMRRYLTRLQRLILAIGTNDFPTAIDIAKSFTLKKGQLVRFSRSGSPGFNTMQISFHTLDAKHLLDSLVKRERSSALIALSKFTKSCTNCHRTYKFIEWPTGKQYKEIGLKTELTLPRSFKIKKPKTP